MNQTNSHLKKLTVLAMMIALDVVLTPVFRIEGMAPMSSVVNIIAAAVMGPAYSVFMALVTAIIRMTAQGIPPLALTGAVFGAFFAGLFYQLGRRYYLSALGEMLGTGIIGSLLSYPVMVWFTGTKTGLFWFIYTPRFIGATLIGTVIALPILNLLDKQEFFKRVQRLFFSKKEAL
ncbi:energy coupling factor transporter S component ThiW [Streptococcus caviae]|uniref:energy coupling factor transporter S component ThiW n=1 Tax=Streptococcus sp. 'caviae' TaxID=1915004 RepID=UPI00094BBAC6|nr:energy coupling factor transporter S component ThiW [Streptococcus sp. 'caviae']OLN83838.1 energy coupling factor transporter S component ThiW [Streptococcus sp. 'caviae']